MYYFTNIKLNRPTIFWCMAYIIITGCFTSAVLLYYSKLLQPIIPPSHLLREYCICFGQIGFQLLILIFFKIKKETIFTYILNMMTVSLLGGLLLLPAFIAILFDVNYNIGFVIYFFVVVLFMFFNHKHRVNSIQAPVWLTYTWVLYRCLVLLMIIL